MQLTKEWLEKQGACIDGIKWWLNQNENDSVEIIKAWVENKEYLDWASWLIVRTMIRPQYLRYAIFAAEQVIDIFEKKYLNDKRPRKAIESAKGILENDCKDTRAAAEAAAWAAAKAAVLKAGAEAGAAAEAAAWAATATVLDVEAAAEAQAPAPAEGATQS